MVACTAHTEGRCQADKCTHAGAHPKGFLCTEGPPGTCVDCRIPAECVEYHSAATNWMSEKI